MRRFVLLICAVSLLAQPAWGWSRTVCRDETPCDEQPCCVAAPCDAHDPVPVESCTLTAPAPRDATPPAPVGNEIHEPVFLAIATVLPDAPALRWALLEVRDIPDAASSVPRRLHAPRAPPRVA